MSQKSAANQSAVFRLSEFMDKSGIEKTRMFYGQGAAAIIANLANSLIVAVVMWDKIPELTIILWTLAVWILVGFRMALYSMFNKVTLTQGNYLSWQNRLVALIFANGVVWGSSAFLLYPEDSLFHQVFLSFVLAGMTSGSVATNSVVLKAFFLFLIPAGIPIAVRFMLHMDIIHIGMSAMCFIYMAALSMAARSVYNTVERMMNLDFDRSEQKLKADLLNAKLLEEMKVRKVAEDDLRQERDIFVGGPVVVFKRRAAEGWPLEYVSPNVSQFGYKPEDLTGNTRLFAEIISSKDLKKVMDEVAANTRAGNQSFQQTYRLVTADGEERWVDDFTRSIIGPDGKVDHYQGYITDTTDRKIFQDRLKESEERYRLLVELSPYAIVLHSEAKVVYANKAAIRLFGLSEDFQFLGINIFEYIHPDSLDRAKTRLKAIMTEWISAPMIEYKLLREDGQQMYVEVVSAPLFHMGKPAAMSILKDITGRKNSENERQEFIRELSEALRKTEIEKRNAQEATLLKDEFVSMVSHDLRAPFGSILSVLKLLKDGGDPPLDPGHQELLGPAIESGDRLLYMVDELLNLSRLKTGKLKASPCFLDAANLAESVLEASEFMARNKGVIIESLVAPGTRIYGDPSLLGQVVQNLVSNSVKFCEKGDRVEIFTPESEPASIAVRDTGPGVDPGILKDLFRHEVKTSKKGSSGEVGTGLGLPFAHDIMEIHGGELTVESAEGKGALFTARLPEIRPSILVVDDDKVAKSILTGLLENMGAEIISASNGQEALEILKSQQPHLVVVDLIMPVMDGFTFLAKLREMPEWGTTPVMTLTSDEKFETREKAFALGADDFIHKTQIRADFIPRVNRLIHRRKGL